MVLMAACCLDLSVRERITASSIEDKWWVVYCLFAEV
jgi:hypothetical protein